MYRINYSIGKLNSQTFLTYEHEPVTVFRLKMSIFLLRVLSLDLSKPSFLPESDSRQVLREIIFVSEP